VLLGRDRIIAETVASHDSWRIWGLGTRWLEIVSGFRLSKWTTGAALLLLALACFVLRKLPAARVLVLVVQLVTRLVAGVLKGLLPRLRPFEVLGAGGWDSQWFQTYGSSFPSGHAAHFWGLFFPLALVRPRLAIWFLPVPLFISAARIAVNDHFLSDVAASTAIVALVTLAASLLPVAARARANTLPAPTDVAAIADSGR
jgi:membrane-associated phospholipid phosphatase